MSEKNSKQINDTLFIKQLVKTTVFCTGTKKELRWRPNVSRQL